MAGKLRNIKRLKLIGGIGQVSLHAWQFFKHLLSSADSFQTFSKLLSGTL